MMLHIFYPQPMSLPNINTLHLTVSEIQPRQDFSLRPTSLPEAMSGNTHTDFKGSGVKYLLVTILSMILHFFKSSFLFTLEYV